MTTPSAFARIRTSLFKSVHTRQSAPSRDKVVDIPTTALTIGAIKKIEQSFWRKNLLNDPKGAHLPLWFIAETERNVSLWKLGLSLDDIQHIEIWVNLPHLIAKRISKIEIEHDLGMFSGNIEELNYLQQIETALIPVLEHAHCLCKAITDALPREHVLILPLS